MDPETGLIYLRNRYYDPGTGQFLSRDPLGALTRSAYGYVYGNPLNGTDPTGLGCGWSDPGSCVSDAAHFVVDHRHDIIDVGTTIGAAVAVGALCVGTAGVGCAAAVVVGVAALGVGAHVGSDALANDPSNNLSLTAAIARSGVSSLAGGFCAITFGQGCPIAAFGLNDGPGLITSNVAGSLADRLAAFLGLAVGQILKQDIKQLLNHC